MKSLLLTTTYSLLISAGLVALSRWFHPATFSPHVVTILLALFAASAALALFRHD